MNAAMLHAGRDASQSVCHSRTKPRSESSSQTRNGGWGGVSLSGACTGKNGRSWFHCSGVFAISKTNCVARSGQFEYSVMRAREDWEGRR
jgi:hypothetical protein